VSFNCSENKWEFTDMQFTGSDCAFTTVDGISGDPDGCSATGYTGGEIIYFGSPFCFDSSPTFDITITVNNNPCMESSSST
jgi:hypothetical protein